MWISPRIWRSPKSEFNDDEPLHAATVYTPHALRQITAQGFNAIWMRGRLWDLIRSEICPELNDQLADRRLASLRTVISNAQALGVKVYLFFNEPLGLPADHRLWTTHPELAGQPSIDFSTGRKVLAVCTSTPQFKAFFDESVGNLLADLPGLGGVILITASEHHSHCWSHNTTRRVDDACVAKGELPMRCPRCKSRQPADIVAELVETWQRHARQQAKPPEIWVWNWSWSMWYDEPQDEIISRLPRGVKLLCDFERGGVRTQDIGDVFIDEYSLGYVGPAERCVGSISHARRHGLGVCAKLQIGVTHELATVPNIPVIPCLFDKLRRVDDLALDGLMCSWNFGNSPSLNTAAMKLYANTPALRGDKKAFLLALEGQYFGTSRPQDVLTAWDCFGKAFGEYPLSLAMLYFGPMNYSVSYALSGEYRDRPMGSSWIWHEPFGDRLEDCLSPFSLDQVLRCLELMDQHWSRGMVAYSLALDDTNNKHQVDELNCATMIGLHISAARNIFDFHDWRRRAMKAGGLDGPCMIDLDEHASDIISRQVATCERALKLATSDERFGYHQEPQARFYTPESISHCIRAMLDQAKSG